MAAKKLPLDGKARTVMVATGGVVLLGLIVVWWSWNRAVDGSATPPPPSSTVRASVPTAAGDGQRASPIYDGLLREDNERAAKVAMQNGTSAMPVIRSGAETATFEIKPRDKEEAKAQEQSRTAEAQPRVVVVPASSANDERARNERAQAIQSRLADMQAQAALLNAAWKTPGHLRMDAPSPKADGLASGSPATPPGTGIGSTQSPAQPPGGATATTASTTGTAARAGDTVVAVLDAPIDTDNLLPLYRATVVEEGPLRGAVLLGQVSAGSTQNRWSTGVPLTFNQISIPGEATQPVNAFAINAEDAGALKGNVNRHTLARYSAAFGGAFLQGVGQGLLAGGREQQVITGANGYAVQSNAYTNKQLAMLGVANVGQIAAGSMQEAINRPPTIRIPAGTTIAIFFASDLIAPQSTH